MHPATPQADRAIVSAAGRLDQYLTTLTDLRAGLAALRLPLPAAEDRLDHVDDLLAIVKSQLTASWALLDDAANGVLAADIARYDNAANDDDQLEDAA